MSNWALPTLTSNYTTVLSEIGARLDDAAKQNNASSVTLTSPPTGLVRWNVNKWEYNSGTPAIPVWTALATTYAINVSTANALSTGRTIGLSGSDASGTSAAWTGSGNITIPLTLTNSGVTAAAYGSSTSFTNFTVDAKGRVTAASSVALGTMAAQNANTVAITGGTIAPGTLTLSTTASNVAGVLRWDSTNNVLTVGTGAAAKTFVSTAPAAATTITNYSMSTGCSWGGTAIPVANGGTGASTAATARTNLGIGTIAIQASGAVAITGGSITGTNITLVNSTTAAPTAEGVIEWDNDNDVLVIGKAAGSQIFAPLTPTVAVTETNRTFSTACTWNGNTLGVAYGGTGVTSITGLLYGNATAAMSAATAAQVVAAISTTPVAKATSLSAGVAGAIPYQSGVGTSGYSLAGTAGHVLVSGGTGAPTWTASPVLSSTVNLTGNQTIAGVKTFSSAIAASITGNAATATTAGTAFAQTLLDDTTAAAARTTLGTDIYKSLPINSSALAGGECYVTTTGFTLSTGSAAGTIFTIYNNSATTIVVTQGAGLTLRFGQYTGSRDIAAYSFGSVLCLSTTEYAITGEGVF